MDVSGIVLAGGMSRRLGRNKAVVPVGGEPLIRRVIGRISQIAEETVVVVAEMEQASALRLPDSLKVAADIFPGGGSLGGIFSGLSAATGEWGLTVSCDMPFLNIQLFRHMLSLRAGVDVVVPVLDGRPEPTHAFYSQRCLPYIERQLRADDLKIVRFFNDVRVSFVPQEVIDRLDPDHLSFFNINTEQDLEQALALVSQGR